MCFIIQSSFNPQIIFKMNTSFYKCTYTFSSSAPVSCVSLEYAHVSRSISCETCPEGYKCPTTSSLIACTSGTYSSAGSLTCTECTAGSYCPITTSGGGMTACYDGWY